MEMSKKQKNTEENRQARRIQTNFLSVPEKKVLVWLAERMPAWVSSDMLTFLGFIGALIIATGYALSNLSLQWLWLASFGLFVNWFGDSLDGTLARVRNQQRKTYGFYIDHNVDIINETIMFIGVGTSPLVNLTFTMAILVNYLLLSVFVYINCHLKGEMQLTFGGLGPTEFRLIAVIINTCFIYIPWLSAWKRPMTLFHNDFMIGIFDYIAVAIAVLIFILFITSFFKDARYFSRIDPPKTPEKK